MTVIRIEERKGTPDGHEAVVSFDGLGNYPATITDPFTQKQEALLEWYFEKRLEFPFTDQVRARQAADSITDYGHALFQQGFGAPRAFAAYRKALEADSAALRIEIVGSPEFHRLHWEALRDPELPAPFALEAPMVRRVVRQGGGEQALPAVMRPSPVINLLIVTARPQGRSDVGYRTISRPLVDGLRQAGVRVNIELLRPGTYRALVNHLQEVRDRHGAGHYHLIHFDVHGALLTDAQFRKSLPQRGEPRFFGRYGGDLSPFAGQKAFLALESEQSEGADLREAGELAGLLTLHQIPIAVLNACQSGKQVGAEETSLASRFMQAGMQTVLAMGYSVTVSAAALAMRTLYERLFAGDALNIAVRRARTELSNDKSRRAYFNQKIDLEDWLLPVVYQNQELALAPRDFTPVEEAAWWERRAARYAFPQPRFGFHGRDIDILQIEKRLLTRGNILLVRGMGGAGKTTLLRHLGAWQQTTGFVDKVIEFPYDKRAWNRQQILAEIAKKIFVLDEYGRFERIPNLDAQQEMVAERLSSHRHLLILDNLESITGENMAIRNTLPPEEREALRRFLARLRGGKTLVLLGSRSGEAWLAPDTFGDSVYDLPGLDPEAASALADSILERLGVANYRTDPDFHRLLKLLAGFPLALEVVLANLERQTPTQVLEALQAGAVDLDPKRTGDDKTASILKCIEYSHSNLSPEAQGLLACLAPFSGVVYLPGLKAYTERLRAQPALAHLPFERWGEVLQQAADWGLVSPHPEQPRAFLALQPVFPYFLRSHLQESAQAEARKAVETAFREFYDQFGQELFGAMEAKEPQQRQTGQILTHMEYENLRHALDLALDAHVSVFGTIASLHMYLSARNDHERGLALSELILKRVEDYPEAVLAGPVGFEMAQVVVETGTGLMQLRRYGEAEQAYQRVLTLMEGSLLADKAEIGRVQATAYHQLGRVAQEQRQWEQAEGHYRQALALFVEFGDRHPQATVYHQLGMVAQEQRQWEQAEGHYRQALALFVEFGDRHRQADTYGQLGILAQEQRQWEQAEGHYRQALAIKVEFGDRYGQASTYHQLGMVAQEQRQWEQAEGHYRRALAIKVEFGDRYGQASAYHQLGRVAEELRQWEQARDHYLTALAIWVNPEFRDDHNAQMALRNLARLWQASGDGELPAAVAAIAGGTPEQVEAFFKQTLASDSETNATE